MHPSRPQLRQKACPTCGTDVDPLRAPQVLSIPAGVRFLCSVECRAKFLSGDRPFEPVRVEAAKPRISIPDRVREATKPTLHLEATPPTSIQSIVSSPTPGLMVAAGGMLFGILPGPIWLALGSMLLTFAACGFALRQGRPLRDELGLAAWVTGPIGAACAAIAGVWDRANEGHSYLLAGAAVAAGSVLIRIWFDRRAHLPVKEAAQALSNTLPHRVRIPVGGTQLAQREQYEKIRESKLRAGEQIVVLEGEVVGADGTIKHGTAKVLLHPSASMPVERGPSDSVMAGAKVVEGAIRILATRTGDERSILRPNRFGEGKERQSAAVAKLAQRVGVWGGPIAIVAAGLGLMLTGTQAWPARIAAAAAALLSVPLLSVRRSAEGPLISAASASARRGIVFQDAASLTTAGKVGTAGFCTTGTITTGRLEVVSVHPVDGADEQQLLALALGCEQSAESHPLAKALRRYCRAHHIQPSDVRRATHFKGRGVQAISDQGETVLFGNRQLLLENGVSVALADGDAMNAESLGQTALFISVGDRVRGVMALSDTIHPGARAAVQRLVDIGIETVLLSGDHRATVEAIAKHIDVTNVKAELLSEERGAEVGRLRQAGTAVAVVGNLEADREALQSADTPIRLDAAGAANVGPGISIASEDPRDAASGLWIANAARTEVWRNLVGSMALGGLLVGAAAFGFIGPGIAAVAALSIDFITLPAGARLLSRIDLRIPTKDR